MKKISFNKHFAIKKNVTNINFPKDVLLFNIYKTFITYSNLDKSLLSSVIKNKYIDKNKELLNVKNFDISHDEINIPHYKKRVTGGEDVLLAEENLFMVADGVGGWASKGVDPGIYSRELKEK